MICLAMMQHHALLASPGCPNGIKRGAKISKRIRSSKVQLSDSFSEYSLTESQVAARIQSGPQSVGTKILGNAHTKYSITSLGEHVCLLINSPQPHTRMPSKRCCMARRLYD